MIFKVVGEARYEYEVEAEDEELAIEEALRRFEEDFSGSLYQSPDGVLDWKAEPVEGGE